MITTHSKNKKVDILRNMGASISDSQNIMDQPLIFYQISKNWGLTIE